MKLTVALLTTCLAVASAIPAPAPVEAENKGDLAKRNCEACDGGWSLCCTLYDCLLYPCEAA